MTPPRTRTTPRLKSRRPTAPTARTWGRSVPCRRCSKRRSSRPRPPRRNRRCRRRWSHCSRGGAAHRLRGSSTRPILQRGMRRRSRTPLRATSRPGDARARSLRRWSVGRPRPRPERLRCWATTCCWTAGTISKRSGSKAPKTRTSSAWRSRAWRRRRGTGCGWWLAPKNTGTFSARPGLFGLRRHPPQNRRRPPLQARASPP
mmetsp:Transcript_46979/g.111893  ORF Transcript_46979/g.111893 Transcript_46979/m.111893 type:complete len:203 (+) Transcript_46979:173-781(+)